MGFDVRTLHCIGYANGFTLWHYHSSDTVAEILSNGYFNPSKYLRLRTGDFIMLHASTGNEAKVFAHLVIVNDDPGINISTQLLASAGSKPGKAPPCPANDAGHAAIVRLNTAHFSRTI